MLKYTTYVGRYTLRGSRSNDIREPTQSQHTYFLLPDTLPSQHIFQFYILYNMSWSQKIFNLPPRSRGSYLITDHVLQEVPEIRDYKVGMLNLFVQHTSCALSLNENWDDDVRADMSDALDRIAPMDKKGNLYRHSAEGEDDMPVCYVTSLKIAGNWESWLDRHARFKILAPWIVLFTLRNRGLISQPGTHQICPNWRIGQYSDHERSLGNGDMAGNLVPRVPNESAQSQGCRDNPGPEGLTG